MDPHPQYIHVAALPFPTPQGTQAAIHSMVCASHQGGHDVQLITHHRGEPHPPLPYPHFRPGTFAPGRGFRSGVSVQRLLDDGRLALRLRRHIRPTGSGGSRGSAQAKIFVAHHVEAAWICLQLNLRPLIFLAHTELGSELPTYFPGGPQNVLTQAGSMLERYLVQRADRTAAVSTHLAKILQERHDRPVSTLPIPWPPAYEASTNPTPPASAASTDATQPDHVRLTYAGNLDPYQGWETMLDALVELRARIPKLLLSIQTQSDTAPLWQYAKRRGVDDRVETNPLPDRSGSGSRFFSGNAILVPRKTPGGLPVKLLEALRTDLPVIAARQATQDLPVEHLVTGFDGENPQSLVQAILTGLTKPPSTSQRTAYLRLHHSTQAWAEAIETLAKDLLQ